jgi:hypothetical protein
VNYPVNCVRWHSCYSWHCIGLSTLIIDKYFAKFHLICYDFARRKEKTYDL